MRHKITREEIENPQRFIGEGLGAPEPGEDKMDLEAKARISADLIHRQS